MLSELGHLLIIFSILSSTCLIFYSVKEVKNKNILPSNTIKNLSFLQIITTSSSFIVLIIAYILSDFSLVNVYEN